ncbi:hypothetical protein P7K49_003790, partial [Saguinus oedipus]
CCRDSQVLVTQIPTARRWRKEQVLLVTLNSKTVVTDWIQLTRHGLCCCENRCPLTWQTGVVHHHVDTVTHPLLP